MRALTVRPGASGSAALEDVTAEPVADHQLEVETILVGICGTDREIAHGSYGAAPPGSERLTLGHEALGRIVRSPEGCELAVGSLVVPVVRRPDPVPCSSCAVGEWVESLIPNDRATSTRGRSEVFTSSMASRRNSGGYFDGRANGALLPLAFSQNQVSTEAGQGQRARLGSHPCRPPGPVGGGRLLAWDVPGHPVLAATRASASPLTAAMSASRVRPAVDRMIPAARATGTISSMLAWMP